MLGSNAQQNKQQIDTIVIKKQITLLAFGLIGNMDMLGMAAQSTDNREH